MRREARKKRHRGKRIPQHLLGGPAGQVYRLMGEVNLGEQSMGARGAGLEAGVLSAVTLIE